MANISGSVKALLSASGRIQGDLIEPLGLGSRQALSNKMSKERWTAGDLVKAADLCGARLAFILPDGSLIYIDGK